MLIEPQWIVLGGVGVLAVGGVLLARAAERKRREALEEFCLMRGFRFEAERLGAENVLAPLAEQFGSSHSLKLRYTLTLLLSRRPIPAFEYRCVTCWVNISHHHDL